MSTFKKCGPSVREMADNLISEFECFAPLRENSVKIDFLFAYPTYDETTGQPISDALTKNGVKALGITKVVNLADRAKGMGDAEIRLDGHWWDNSDEAEQRALLDHELFHIVPTAKRDDLGRPIIKMRKHDVECGWFISTAERHGVHSQERKQAKRIMDGVGQYLFPELMNAGGSRLSSLELDGAGKAFSKGVKVEASGKYGKGEE